MFHAGRKILLVMLLAGILAAAVSADDSFPSPLFLTTGRTCSPQQNSLSGTRNLLSPLFGAPRLSCGQCNPALHVAGSGQNDQYITPEEEGTKIRSVNEYIRNNNLSWTAGRTSVSNLTPRAYAAMLGGKLPNTARSFSVQGEIGIAEGCSTISLPAAFDWRENEGDWTTPVKNQGSCGGCWAFGATAVFESFWERINNDPDLNPNFAEQYLVSCDSEDIGCYGGTTWALKYLVNQPGRSGGVGTVAESDYPYSSGGDGTVPSCKALTGIQRYKVPDGGSWHDVVGPANLTEATAITKEVIYTKGPIVTTMDASENFSYYTGGIFEDVACRHQTNHIVTLIGWGHDPVRDKDYWIAKNSWSRGWGENGWFRIYTDQCLIGGGSYLEAAPDTIFITSMNPRSGYRGRTTAFTLNGTNFLSGATVNLVKSGNTPISCPIDTVNFSQINASGSLPPSTETGYWDLVVTNPNGTTATRRKAFAVLAPGPVVDFTAAPRYGTPPLTVQFTDTSAGSPTVWSWDFGDGTFSTERSPVHIYSSLGSYTVSLTATNSSDTNTLTKPGYIFVDYSTAVDHSDATMFRANPQHTGTYDDGGIRPVNNIRWNYTTKGPVVSSPAVINGVMYVGSSAGNGNDHTMYAFIASNGTKLWTYTTDAWVTSSPAVADGVIYFGGNGNGAGQVYALNATTGAKIWNYTTGTRVIVDSSPTVAGGVVYVGIYRDYFYGDEFIGLCDYTYALNATTGQEIWNSTGYGGGQSPTVADGLVYTNGGPPESDGSGGYGPERLYALNAATGSESWNFTSPTATYDTFSPNPAVANGIAFVSGGNYSWEEDKDYAKVFALNTSTGKPVWYSIITDAAAVSDPAVAGGIVYVGTRGGTPVRNGIYAMVAETGEYLWSYPIPSQSLFLSSPSVANGIVYVNDFRNSEIWSYAYSNNKWWNDVYALDAGTGELLWNFTIGPFGYIYTQPTSPAIADGIVFVGMADGNIYALGSPLPANFTADVTHGLVPLTVRFTDTSTSQNITSWNWSFGDGEWFTTTDPVFRNPSHIFSGSGNFTVSLTITNASGIDTKTRPDFVSVASLFPVNFTASETSGPAPLTVFFNGTTGCIDPISWNWSFGDGSFYNTTDPARINVSHTYWNPGRFTVGLAVSNNSCTDAKIRQDYITAGALPAAGFTANLTSGPAPLTVRFIDTSRGYLTAWNWSFGDGAFSEEQNPVHTYRTIGFYTVSLTATNGNGDNMIVKPAIVMADYAEVTMSHANRQRTGEYDNGGIRPTGTLNWSYATGDLVRSSPAVINGVLYAGSDDHKVYAINTTTGIQIWNFTTGDRVPSSPAVADGVVYVGSYDHNMYAINATDGTRIWNFTTGGSIYSSPLVACGIVYTGSINASEKSRKLYALDATTGTQIWSSPLESAVHLTPAVADGMVFIGGNDGDWKVYALNALTGQRIWTYEMDESISSDPIVVSGGIVYVGCNDGKVYAINAATGTKIWDYTVYGSGSGPAVADGIVYISDTGGWLHEVNATDGTVIRAYELNRGISESTTVANGVVYLLEYNRGAFAFNATDGTLLWNYVPNRGVTLGSPAVAEGMVFFGGDKIYALGGTIAPHANFIANVTAGSPPLSVNFTDTSTDSPDSWNWSFGDGSSSTAQNPVHVYATPGTYTVSLTAMNAYGSNTRTRADYIAGTVPAPAISWQKSLGGSNGEESFKSIEGTSDGGYILAGYAGSNDGDVSGNHGGSEWVVKIDDSGNITWQKCIGGSIAEQAYSIQQTADGGYIVAGWTFSDDGDVSGNHGIYDYWVVKLDGSGNITWQKCLGGTKLDVAESVKQTADGGYIVAGWTFSNDGDVSGKHGGGENSPDYWVVKLDGSGNMMWQKCLGGSGVDTATSIQQTADGGYVVTGSSNSNDGDVSGNHLTWNWENWYSDLFRWSFDYWVVKLDGSGNIMWQKCLGGSGDDAATSIQQTADGGYVVTGSSKQVDDDHPVDSTNSDYWITRLDDGGNIVWQKYLGGTMDDDAYSIVQTLDGGYIVAGWTYSIDGDVSGKHGGEGYPDSWVVKLDSDGNILWQKCLGGSMYDDAYSIVQTLDGGYIVAGWTSSNDGDVFGNHGYYDAWLVKLGGNVSAPFAEFSATPISGPVPLTVTFRRTSPGPLAAWSWTFGDGDATNATMEDPVHTYTSPGTYTVTHTVSNGAGDDTAEGQVRVYGRGDFNGNGRVDIGDVTSVAYMAANLTPLNPAADFTGDGTVDIADAAKIAWYYVGKIPELYQIPPLP